MPESDANNKTFDGPTDLDSDLANDSIAEIEVLGSF